MLRSVTGWLTPAIPAFGKLRQEDFHEMGTSLGCILNSRPGCRPSQGETLFKQTNKQTGIRGP